MVACEVCGGEDFEKHDGYMYCAVCQTQSQHYYEQEYEYHEANVTRQQKSRTRSLKSKKKEVYDDGFWTSWEGFNYILYGMSEEIKKCGGNKDFEENILKLWAAYLSKCQAAFISRYEEKIPKLRYRFKHRDARVLYNVDMSSNASRSRKFGSKSSKVSYTSDSSMSKRSISLQKGKVIAVDYQDYLSSSMQSSSNLADETLESLGKSSDLETGEESSDGNESLVRGLKHMFTKKDLRLYKNLSNSRNCKARSKGKAANDVSFPGKNKLLSLIHLALLMTGSQIQLSDLLRFIRESHLSFAKVTHFFPINVKFPKKDFSYIEVTSDALMPTHLRQRSISGQIARLLNIDEIPTPDMNFLVDRYCKDLNLPNQLAEFSKRILNRCVSPSVVPRSRTPLPSFEAWAMVSIIFVMKLLLGLNDRTEVFLSELAREMNKTRGGSNCLFVFSDWQKFIECRKTVLTHFHYPTQEQLDHSSLRSSKKFLDVLMKESKDEFRKDRFVPYPSYYMDENLLSGITQMLNVLAKPQNVVSLEFPPSLTPQISHLEAIMRDMSERGKDDVRGESADETPTAAFPEVILRQSFTNCDLQFTFNPEKCAAALDKDSDIFTKFNFLNDFYDFGESCERSNTNSDFFACFSRYWSFHYPRKTSGYLSNFREEILEKTPENFQWLLTECARAVEMNARDVFEELLQLERKLSEEWSRDVGHRRRQTQTFPPPFDRFLGEVHIWQLRRGGNSSRWNDRMQTILSPNASRQLTFVYLKRLG